MYLVKIIGTTLLLLGLTGTVNAGIDISGRLLFLRGQRCSDVSIFSLIFLDAQRAGLSKKDALSEVTNVVREMRFGIKSNVDREDLWEKHQSDIETALNEMYELEWVPEEVRVSTVTEQCKRQDKGKPRLTPKEIRDHLSRLPICEHFLQKNHCKHSLIWLDQKEFARRVPLLCSSEGSPPPASITISTNDLEWAKELIEGGIVFTRDHDYVFRGRVEGFKYSSPRLMGFGGIPAVGVLVTCGIVELARRLGKCVVYMSEDTENRDQRSGPKNSSTLNDFAFIVGLGDSGRDQAQFNDPRLSKAALYLDAKLSENAGSACDVYRAKP